MRKIREVLRLRAEGFSGRLVAQSLSLGRATVSDYFRRADIEGLSWPLADDLGDVELERLLFPRSVGKPAGSKARNAYENDYAAYPTLYQANDIQSVGTKADLQTIRS